MSASRFRVVVILACMLPLRVWGQAGFAGGEFQVNTYTYDLQRDAAVASDGAGNFVVVWEGGYSQDGSGRGVFGQRFDATGTPLGSEFQANTFSTNDQKDAWFIGFSPDLVVGIYVGYDKPRNLGRQATGGHLAAPIAHDFMKVALADKPATPFRIPAGIKLVRVDSKTGMRAGPGSSGKTILEAFKPGTAPPDNYSVIGVADANGREPQPLPDADRSLFRPGTGGLY